MSQNHYQVLGVSAAATAREIKQAYKRLAVQYHPDKHGGSALHEELFKAVAAAYRVLSDPGRRAQYDFQLQVAVRRAAEVRRQQEFRQQGQRVYGVPMPPPAPLRTRRPAGSHERHYRTIPRQRARFTRRDFQLIAVIVLTMLLFGWVVKLGLDRMAASRAYQSGLGAYARREWSAAHSFFSEAIRLRSGYTQAFWRRGEVEELGYQRPQAAVTDYIDALAKTALPKQRANLLVRIGLCYQAMQRPELAQQAVQQALVLDSTQAQARLLKGETLLFSNQYAPAHREFEAGLRHARAFPSFIIARLLLYRGLVNFKEQDYRAARADYWQVLAIYPNQARVYFLLGRVAQQEGSRQEACEFFRRAVVQGYRFAEAARDTTCRP
ncbi:J domain-containing protein [Hymenobacter tenuis]